MNNYEEFCLSTEVNLGRTLEQKELEFLCWLYNRHLEEKNKEKPEHQREGSGLSRLN